MAKPFDGQECGGNYCNVPVAHDGSEEPVTSPIAAGDTEELVVPNTAARLNLLANGSAAATVVIKKGNTAKSGTITVPAGVQVAIDCAGMSTMPVTDDYPDTISVTAGAATPVSFWFDCLTDGGQ